MVYLKVIAGKTVNYADRPGKRFYLVNSEEIFMPPYGNFSFESTAWDEIADYTDHLVVTVTREGGLSTMARRVNAMSKGAIKRAVEHQSF